MAESQLDDKLLRRQEAIIGSMTPKERRDIRVLNGSRRRRIAGGCWGRNPRRQSTASKQFKQISSMMKKVGKMGKKGKGLSPEALRSLIPPQQFPQ